MPSENTAEFAKWGLRSLQDSVAPLKATRDNRHPSFFTNPDCYVSRDFTISSQYPDLIQLALLLQCRAVRLHLVLTEHWLHRSTLGPGPITKNMPSSSSPVCEEDVASKGYTSLGPLSHPGKVSRNVVSFV